MNSDRIDLMIAFESIEPLRGSYRHSIYDQGAERFTGDRQLQYLAGRRACRHLLTLVGKSEDLSVGFNQVGAPIFPCGISGSISHSSTLAAAVIVAPPHEAAIGIDIEPFSRYEDESPILSAFFTQNEQRWLQDRHDCQNSFKQLLLSAKESCWKTLNLRNQQESFYHNIELELYDIDSSTLMERWHSIGYCHSARLELWATLRYSHLAVVAVGAKLDDVVLFHENKSVVSIPEVVCRSNIHH